jgi:hypothetical protein
LRLVPKNLRNYLQTPTLIGCKFLTNSEATFRLLRLACCDQRSLVVYHGFLSTVKLFSLSSSSQKTFFKTLLAPRNLRREALKLFQRSLRLCTVFCNPVNFEGSFFSHHLLAIRPEEQPPKAPCERR